MARGRGGRSAGRRLGCAVGALVMVVLLVLGIGIWLGMRGVPPGPGGDGPFPGGGEPERAQPADCPDVELLAVPGTWESSPTDDP